MENPAQSRVFFWLTNKSVLSKIQGKVQDTLRPRQRSRVAHRGLNPKSGFMDLLKDSLISSLGIKESFNNN